MINQYEVSGYLEEALPGFNSVIDAEKKNSLYVTIYRLLTFTTQRVSEHNYTAAKKCLDAVAKLYDKGNSVVKNAVENVYVYSFSNLIYAANTDKGKLLSIIPITLYTLYVNQLYASNC